MAERVGFEPTVRLHVRLISSQVHSTTLPPLRSVEAEIIAGNLCLSERNADFDGLAASVPSMLERRRQGVGDWQQIKGRRPCHMPSSP